MHVQRLTAAYKQGQGDAQIQSQSMVENLAADIKKLLRSVATCQAARKVNEGKLSKKWIHGVFRSCPINY